MNEKFKIIDLKSLKTKKGKDCYIAVIYSNLGYLINCFINKENYDFLCESDFYRIDAGDYITKRYDQTSGKMSYFFDIASAN